MEGKPVFAPQVCTCENSVLSNAKKDGQWNIRGYQWLVGFIYLYMKLRWKCWVLTTPTNNGVMFFFQGTWGFPWDLWKVRTDCSLRAHTDATGIRPTGLALPDTQPWEWYRKTLRITTSNNESRRFPKSRCTPKVSILDWDFLVSPIQLLGYPHGTLHILYRSGSCLKRWRPAEKRLLENVKIYLALDRISPMA